MKVGGVVEQVEGLIRAKLERLNLDARSRRHLCVLLASLPLDAGVRAGALGPLLAGLGRCHPDISRAQVEAFAEVPEVSADENVHVNHLNMALLFVASSSAQHHEAAVESAMADAARELVVERRREGLPGSVEGAASLFAEIFSSGRLWVERSLEGTRLELGLEVPGRGLMGPITQGLLACHFEHHVGGVERVRACWSDERRALIEVMWRVDPLRAAR